MHDGRGRTDHPALVGPGPPRARAPDPPADERGAAGRRTPMNLPTERRWARYSALCARLRLLPAAECEAALQPLRAQGSDNPQVLSLVALHLALPPDPN